MANADPHADRFEKLRADHANKSPDDPTNWPTFLTKVVDMGLAGTGHDLDELNGINQAPRRRQTDVPPASQVRCCATAPAAGS